ncbi:1-aminocyclopropane-1-carboxylate oxidase-like protein 5 [Hibiscus syriacus]|uniref:1-aminocyclopropane-1-carboxylate oxidase-like protein 5 n=1 Tax=Hibiscus syriacus TaxID=106335 RepID=A0A6A3B960_HIBSY|nr:1-aminocyclopropane-1-carboxylate oxidase-like protein 5 [Hibiscus syriacus]
MASIPKLYTNCAFPNSFSQFPNPQTVPQENYTVGGGGAIIPGATWGEEISFPMLLDNGGIDVFQQISNLTAAVPAALFPYQLQDDYEFGEECTGFVHQDFKPVDPRQNWGIQGNQIWRAMEDSNLKVGRYSVEERKDRILRYLKKRNQRNFNKTIKYACRKTLADRRVRVRGRFARNTQLCEDQETVFKKEADNSSIDKNLYNCCEAIRMKHDEDDWLQEAMANLMYLPYIAG